MKVASSGCAVIACCGYQLLLVSFRLGQLLDKIVTRRQKKTIFSARISWQIPIEVNELILAYIIQVSHWKP